MEEQPAAELDAVAQAFLATWEHLLTAVPGAWTRRLDETLGAVSTVPVAMMNGAWAVGSGGDAALVAELLGEVDRSGLPHCLQLRPCAGGDLLALAETLNMAPHPAAPLLTIRELGEVERTLAATDVALRQLEPREAPLHQALAAEGFGMPQAFLAQIASPAVLALPGVKTYIAESDGEAVATALAVRIERHVGIFNVATPSRHRRRGYGAAVTALAVRDAFDDGADRAWLQSSPMGLGVYERLGFALAESWQRWVSQPASG
jgi:GNAT superfamily N-acetyltransferase